MITYTKINWGNRIILQTYVVMFLLLSIGLNFQNSFAATKTWNGSVSSDWTDPSNWDPSGVPGTGDDVVITAPLSRYPVILSSQSISIRNIKINSGGSISISGTFTTNGNKITIDGGTFTQSGGTVSTNDMELKNGGKCNQTDGEFQISHDLRVPSGTTFNGTGGTVHFTGVAGPGADYTGNVQFYNVLIDAAADYNSDNNSDNIKIAGNFVNNNSGLTNDKGTVTFNGTSPQTIYSASTPANTKTTFGKLVISNSSGVTLLTDLGVKTSFSYSSGGYLNTDSKNFYVGGSLYNGPLPVELTSFSASVSGSTVILTWATATEVNNYGFEIERQAHISTTLSVTGWEKIGFVSGNGNSNTPKSYGFDDKSIESGKYSYRLKQIDNDGQFEYSKEIEVDLGTPETFTVSQNYPNPFNPSTVIKYKLSGSIFVTLKIYDTIGNEIATLVNEQKDAGSYEVKFDGSTLSSGMYVYQLTAGNFVITKKMILMK